MGGSSFRLFAVTFLYTVALACSQALDAEPWTTPLGQVRPTFDPATNSTSFRGLRYSAPVRRWKLPEPLEAWNGIYDATAYRSPCIQFDNQGLAPGNYSEDCLYMNLYLPPGATASASPGLPVVLWIHGGYFVWGTGNVYDSTQLAIQGNVIVATINYRLGPFGFLAMESLHSDSAVGAGNYGIADQRQALKFLRQYIQYFGGDPNNIVVAGESAGAISACIQATAPLSQNLLKGAIMQSGFCTLNTWNQSLALAQPFLARLNCSSLTGVSELECLKGLTAAEILAASAGVRWFASTNLADLALQPYEILASNSYHPVPLLIGTDEDEETFFLCGSKANISAAGFETEIRGSFPTIADQIIKLYPLINYNSPFYALVDVWSDYEFKCPTRRIANILTRKGSNVWMYSFNTVPGWASGPLACLRAGHSMELPFLFPGLTPLGYNFTSTESSLSQWMLTAWTDFARAQAAPSLWTKFSPLTSDYIRLLANAEPKPVELMLQNFRQEYCDFWDSVATPPTTPTPANAPMAPKHDGLEREPAGYVVLAIVGGVTVLGLVGAAITVACRRYRTNRRSQAFERL